MAYSKTNWSPTVAITPSNLNKIEQGIFDNDANIGKLESDISDAWNSSVTYGVNSYCIYNNKLWKCKVQHTNQPPTEGTYWTACTISGEISELNSNLNKFEQLTLTSGIKNYVSGDIHFAKYGHIAISTFNLKLSSTNPDTVLLSCPNGFAPKKLVIGTLVDYISNVPIRVSLMSDGFIVQNTINKNVALHGQLVYFIE